MAYSQVQVLPTYLGSAKRSCMRRLVGKWVKPLDLTTISHCLQWRQIKVPLGTLSNHVTCSLAVKWLCAHQSPLVQDPLTEKTGGSGKDIS